jgi:AcrR family transcriptional regulator
MSPRTDEQNQTILDRRREEILSAALAEFARKGYSGTKISDIAKSGGISQGLIYHYYKSKDELYASVIEKSIEDSYKIVQVIEAYELKGWRALVAMTEWMIEWMKNAGDEILNFLFMYQAFMLDPMPECIKAALSKEMRTIPATAEMIAEAQKEGFAVEGDAYFLASMYWSLIQGIIMVTVTSKQIQTNGVYTMPDTEFLLRFIKKPINV